MSKGAKEDGKYLWTFVDENDMIFWSRDSDSVYMGDPGEFMPPDFIGKRNNILKSNCAFNPFRKSGIVAGGISTKGKNYYQSIGRHEYFSVIIVAGGALGLSDGKNKLTLKAADMALVPPEAACDFRVKSAPAPILWFNLGKKWIPFLGRNADIRISRCKNFDFLLSLSEAYISELFSKNPDMPILSGCSNLIIRALRRELKECERAQAEFKKLEARISAIERGGGGKIAAAELAKKLGMPLSKLNGYALRTRNMTFPKIVHKRQMEIAAEMLSAGKASCAEAGERLGFSSQFAFSRSFKAYYGIPPSACLGAVKKPVARARNNGASPAGSAANQESLKPANPARRNRAAAKRL